MPPPGMSGTLGMRPTGSDMPMYAVHRDLLYRFPAFIIAGLAAIEKLTISEEDMEQCRQTALQLRQMIDTCKRRTLQPDQINTAMTEMRAQYPVGYAICMDEIIKALFMQYRVFIGEQAPALDDPASAKVPELLQAAEARVQRSIDKQKE